MAQNRSAKTNKKIIKARPQQTLTFRDFFLIWATQVNHWKVPAFHLRLVDFLEQEQWSNDTAVIQIFRGAGKSTIIALFIAWKLTVDPTLRFLVVSASAGQAKRISKSVREIIMHHPFAGWLIPTDMDKSWTSTEITVSAATDPSTPSVDARGAQSSITGTRADYIIYDDIEVPKYVKTEAMRDQIRERVAEGTHILVPGGKKIFLGTPHTTQSVYKERIDLGDTSLTIPLLTNLQGTFPYYTGESAWPENFTQRDIEKRQKASKSNANFLAQYQLLPSLINDSRLDASKIVEYSDELSFSSFRGKTLLRLGTVQLTRVSCFWDVASGNVDGDDSVISIVYVSDSGHYYVHRTVALIGGIEDQCAKVKELVKEFAVNRVVVETNGLGNFVPAILRKFLEGTRCAVEGFYSTENKERKIIETFEIPLSARLIHAHASVVKSPFKIQLQQFHPTRKSTDHDDYIDSVSSAIKQTPMLISDTTFNLINHPSPVTTWGNYAGDTSVELTVDKPF